MTSTKTTAEEEEDMDLLRGLTDKFMYMKDRNAPGVIWDICFAIREAYDIGYRRGTMRQEEATTKK